MSDKWVRTSPTKRRPTCSAIVRVSAAILVAGLATSACGWTTNPAGVACGRLEQAECDAAVNLATSQLPPTHPSIKKTAADFLCAPGNPCQAGFRVVVAFGFGSDREPFAVLVSGAQGAETAVPLQ
jgi:hypothetical protein